MFEMHKDVHKLTFFMSPKSANILNWMDKTGVKQERYV